MKHFFNLFCRMTALMYPLSLHNKIERILDMIYTEMVSRSLQKVGKGFLCERCIRLWNPKHICVGDNVQIFSRSILAVHSLNNGTFGRIFIGSGSTLGEYSHITALVSVTIGDNVLLGRRVTITDNSHGKSDYKELITPPI